MSNVNKKRPRKAKLETRMCVENDDEFTSESQISAIKITDVKSMSEESFPSELIEHVKTEPSHTEIEAPKPFNFSVNVEVEEFDDEDRLQIDESAFESDQAEMEVDVESISPHDKMPFTSITNKLIANYERDISLAINSVPSTSAVPNIIIKTERVTPDRDIAMANAGTGEPSVPNQHRIDVTELQILEATNKLLKSSNNMADKILAIESRNILGDLTRIVLDKDMVEEKLQDALDDWTNWTADSERTSPLLYKCYVCLYACWHLSKYRKHLRTHPNANLKISVEETSLDECNIVAYTGALPEKYDIDTNGSCGKCERDFSVHKLAARTPDGQYRCQRCPKTFNTCYQLRKHEYTSINCCNTAGNLKCKFCYSLFTTDGERQNHMLTRHNVRSDIPIPTAYKKCNDCGLKYSVYNLHSCQNKVCNYKCGYCFRRFKHRLLAELHMETGNPSWGCRVCNMELPKRCMELEHILMHTTSFVFPYKCVTCLEFVLFLDEESLMQHRYQKHNIGNDMRRIYSKVLVPIACLLPIFENIQVQVVRNTDQDRLNVALRMFADAPGEGPSIPDLQPEVQIKVEPDELVIKEECLTDPEYEDDIIQLSLKPGAPRKRKHTKQSRIYSCNNCSFQGVHSDFRAHSVDCLKSYLSDYVSYYPCSKCGTTFNKLKKYLGHFPEHGLTPISCPECRTIFSDYQQLVSHLYVHIKQCFLKIKSINTENAGMPSEKKMNRCCRKCSMEILYDDMFVHWESHLSISDDENVAEETVSETAENKPQQFVGLEKADLDLLLEKLQSLKKVRECPQCGRTFARNYDCKRHLIEHLLTDAYAKKPQCGTLKCQICSEAYCKADRYKRHMRDHGAMPIFQCELCNKAFSDSSNFTKHKKHHNLKVLICDLCNKKFQAKSSLEKHLEMHRVTEPETCTACSKIFHTKSLYNKHMRLKHNNDPKFTCIICKARFSTSKEKMDHLWEVHKERYSQADCRICGKLFRKVQDLKKHLLIEHKMSYRTYCGRMDPKKNLQMFIHNPDGMRGGETLVIFET